ncbi:3-deoxy-7-phosphoheptulonate synthase [Streptomyces sp. NPDC048718]|uniref:3-deoxy-7-phosphoheptulonate synthase n=1 Tax=Streptomyces sp. NPDC048718 TaxID=3365587 RepID=UPI003714F6DA
MEFAAGVANPVGVKLGPGASVDDVLALAARIDPDRTPGRLGFITQARRARSGRPRPIPARPAAAAAGRRRREFGPGRAGRP